LVVRLFARKSAESTILINFMSVPIKMSFGETSCYNVYTFDLACLKLVDVSFLTPV